MARAESHAMEASLTCHGGGRKTCTQNVVFSLLFLAGYIALLISSMLIQSVLYTVDFPSVLSLILSVFLVPCRVSPLFSAEVFCCCFRLLYCFISLPSLSFLSNDLGLYSVLCLLIPAHWSLMSKSSFTQLAIMSSLSFLINLLICSSIYFCAF